MPSSVEYLCERLRAASSGRIGVQGVIMILPVDWLNRPDAPRLATAYRGDLQAIASILDLRPPVYVVVTGMESDPGFLEFARRMKESFRTRRRCGFYLPGDPGDTTGLVHGGLVWFSGWYQTWMLYLMANEPVDHRGNNALFTLGSHYPPLPPPTARIARGGDRSPARRENIPLNGCYFAATGPSPDTVACAAGIIRGRVLDDAAATRWDCAGDRTRPRLPPVGPGGRLDRRVRRAPGLGLHHRRYRLPALVGLAMPVALVAAWVATLLRMR